MPAYAHFEIDIVSALADQLIAAFQGLLPEPLTEPMLHEVPPKHQGVYQLYHQDVLVYVGKANDLKTRLSEHREKVLGRRDINVDDVTFKCLSVHRNWTALAPEETLIRYYRKTNPKECSWNGNGFGQHDPGRNREETNKPPDGFDAQYPIREDWVCDWIQAGTLKGHDLLATLKKNLPFLLRYERGPNPAYHDKDIVVPEDRMSARDLLKSIASQLPGWQATVFPSHMILYKESRPYTYGRVIWPLPTES